MLCIYDDDRYKAVTAYPRWGDVKLVSDKFLCSGKEWEGEEQDEEGFEDVDAETSWWSKNFVSTSLIELFRFSCLKKKSD